MSCNQVVLPPENSGIDEHHIVKKIRDADSLEQQTSDDIESNQVDEFLDVVDRKQEEVEEEVQQSTGEVTDQDKEDKSENQEEEEGNNDEEGVESIDDEEDDIDDNEEESVDDEDEETDDEEEDAPEEATVEGTNDLFKNFNEQQGESQKEDDSQSTTPSELIKTENDEAIIQPVEETKPSL